MISTLVLILRSKMRTFAQLAGVPAAFLDFLERKAPAFVQYCAGDPNRCGDGFSDRQPMAKPKPKWGIPMAKRVRKVIESEPELPSRFSFGKLDRVKQSIVLEECATQLRLALESTATSEEGIFEQLEDRLVGELKLPSSPDKRQRLSLLRELWIAGYIRLTPRYDADTQKNLKDKFRLSEVVVVNGGDPYRFAQAAAELFIVQLRDIGLAKKARGNRPLNVGIVSGRTTGDVIAAACALDWKTYFGLNANDLPEVRLFALNVCLTVPEHGRGNATVLVNKLADKINSECADSSGTHAKPYGLSAPLLVERSALPGIDGSPQTLDVVCSTQPFRVIEKLKQLAAQENQDGTGRYSQLARDHGLPANPNDIREGSTNLDIVLAGVGEPPVNKPGSPGSSIFCSIAEEVGINMENLVEKFDVVGDIAFTAIDPNGEPVPLQKSNNNAGGIGASEKPTEYVFYSAVDLPTLERMVSDGKTVILVARHSGGRDAKGPGKGPAIAAAVKGRPHKYASHLVLDELTASDLLPGIRSYS